MSPVKWVAESMQVGQDHVRRTQRSDRFAQATRRLPKAPRNARQQTSGNLQSPVWNSGVERVIEEQRWAVYEQ